MPDVKGLSYIPKDQTENKQCRIDLNDQIAARNTRFFGYIGEMKHGTSDNTTTPYEIYIVGRIAFWEDNMQGKGPSCIGPDTKLLS